ARIEWRIRRAARRQHRHAAAFDVVELLEVAADGKERRREGVWTGQHSDVIDDWVIRDANEHRSHTSEPGREGNEPAGRHKQDTSAWESRDNHRICHVRKI